MQLLKIIVGIILIIGFVSLAVHNVSQEREIRLHNQIELKSKEEKLIELNTKYDELIELKTKTDKQKEDKAKRIEELNQEINRLEVELQAKKQQEEKERQSLARASQTVTQTQTVQASSWIDQCHIWAKQAGVTLTPTAIELIRRESSCNPTVWNRQGSGAYGIAQALPASKLPNGVNTSPPDQIRWMYNYVMGRYGSWEAALSFHDRNNWY